jgi:hypothetical protein
MSPERQRVIGKQKVSEYYWAGEYPVYVGNQLVHETYEQACARLEADEIAARHGVGNQSTTETMP